MWYRYELANAFDAKIDVHGALDKLVDCMTGSREECDD
jgi:hypothetical protein